MTRVGTWNESGAGPFIEADEAKLPTGERGVQFVASGMDMATANIARVQVMFSEVEWIQFRACVDAVFLRDGNGTGN